VGVIGASAVMCVRVLIATSILNPAVVGDLGLYLAAPFTVAALVAWWGNNKHPDSATTGASASNPLQFKSAIQMAALFQIVLIAVRWIQNAWGQIGLLVSAGVIGLTDVDALVISMAKGAGGGLPSSTIAQAIAIGVLTNTLLKLFIGLAFGRKDFRKVVGGGLTGVALASAASIFISSLMS
jgi:uncharacterized membrane protein (DUF4010 family)